jgi:hypothetical protein
MPGRKANKWQEERKGKIMGHAIKWKNWNNGREGCAGGNMEAMCWKNNGSLRFITLETKAKGAK